MGRTPRNACGSSETYTNILFPLNRWVVPTVVPERPLAVIPYDIQSFFQRNSIAVYPFKTEKVGADEICLKFDFYCPLIVCPALHVHYHACILIRSSVGVSGSHFPHYRAGRNSPGLTVHGVTVKQQCDHGEEKSDGFIRRHNRHNSSRQVFPALKQSARKHQHAYTPDG